MWRVIVSLGSHTFFRDSMKVASIWMVERILLYIICTLFMVGAVACKKSKPEIGTAPGAGKINACSLITREDAEMMMGAKKLVHADRNECYVRIQPKPVERLSNRTLASAA